MTRWRPRYSRPPGPAPDIRSLADSEGRRVPPTFWIQATLERLSEGFQSSQAVAAGRDPATSSLVKIHSTSTREVGPGLSERVIQFRQVQGPVTLAETPIPGTLQVLSGSLVLGSSVYTVEGNTLSFLTPQGDLTVRYQTSPLSANAGGAPDLLVPVVSKFWFYEFSLESAS